MAEEYSLVHDPATCAHCRKAQDLLKAIGIPAEFKPIIAEAQCAIRRAVQEVAGDPRQIVEQRATP
jgi:glutaredoxin